MYQTFHRIITFLLSEDSKSYKGSNTRRVNSILLHKSVDNQINKNTVTCISMCRLKIANVLKLLLSSLKSSTKRRLLSGVKSKTRAIYTKTYSVRKNNQ